MTDLYTKDDGINLPPPGGTLVPFYFPGALPLKFFETFFSQGAIFKSVLNVLKLT
jgi:hypothetical protein